MRVASADGNVDGCGSPPDLSGGVLVEGRSQGGVWRNFVPLQNVGVFCQVSFNIGASHQVSVLDERRVGGTAPLRVQQPPSYLTSSATNPVSAQQSATLVLRRPTPFWSELLSWWLLLASWRLGRLLSSGGLPLRLRALDTWHEWGTGLRLLLRPPPV